MESVTLCLSLIFNMDIMPESMCARVECTFTTVRLHFRFKSASWIIRREIGSFPSKMKLQTDSTSSLESEKICQMSDSKYSTVSQSIFFTRDPLN